MRQVPEPDRGEWVRRLRERARLDAEELLPRPPFGVFGLAAPQLRPVALVEAGQVNGVWETITLAYGDWADPAGPFVTITSAAVRPDAPGPGAEAELVRVIGRERNRIADHAGIDEEEPPGHRSTGGKSCVPAAGGSARWSAGTVACRRHACRPPG